MKLTIRHHTRYSFDEQVFLEPHYLRFRPRSSPHLKVHAHDLTITPEPSGNRAIMDAEGNLINFCWFSEVHDRMEVTAASVVELTPYNPFDFLIYPSDYTTFPFQYTSQDLPLLQPALTHQPIGSELKEFCDTLAEQSQFQTVTFLGTLTKTIHERSRLQVRETGAPHDPMETFKNKKGSCRDLAWMQLQLLRSKGFASRFVSGYLYLNTEHPQYELHAWLEVYLPGAGWIAMDPSHGMIADHRYITLATGTSYEGTMPVTGSTRGNAKGQLYTELDIEEIP